MSDIIGIVLIALLVWEKVFHDITTSKLINKIMSRDFFAYQQAEGLKSQMKEPLQPQFVEEVEDY